LFFFKDDLQEVKRRITELKVAAPAKAGTFAPIDVIVPSGPTGMEPTQTSFLQALNIPSKINRGQIEIVNDVFLIKKGAKVGASEANLLAKLDIKPFSYGLVIRTVYENGNVYDASVLEMTDNDILTKFQTGVRKIASLSLALHYPTVASVPHSLINGYKRVLAIGLGTEYTFPKAEAMKKALLAGPSTSNAPKTDAPKDSGKVAPSKETKKPEPEPEEEEADMGFGLFD